MAGLAELGLRVASVALVARVLTPDTHRMTSNWRFPLFSFGFLPVPKLYCSWLHSVMAARCFKVQRDEGPNGVGAQDLEKTARADLNWLVSTSRGLLFTDGALTVKFGEGC